MMKLILDLGITQQKIADMKGGEQKGSYVDYRIQRMQTPSQLVQTFREI